MNKFLALLLVLCTTIATMVAMGERTPWVPRETGLALPAAAAAPAPAPVPAPEIPAAATPVAAVTSAAPVLAPAVTTTTNSWVNAQTCGWVSGFSCKFLAPFNFVLRDFLFRSRSGKVSMLWNRLETAN